MTTPYTQLRLGPLTLSDLDALSASAGSRTQAARECVAYWRRLVTEAAATNAAELSEEDWVRLAHLNQPDPLAGMPDDWDEDSRAAAPDWSARLAQELCGMWEGRELVLPGHKTEAVACRKLAKRIADWGVLRGYALMACLRRFWRERDSAGEWWRPEAWLAKREVE